MADKQKTGKDATGTDVAVKDYDADELREEARVRGVAEADLKKLPENTICVVSNRADDVVVFWEQDPRHPGGEAFIGGSAPDLVYRTGRVDAALREGLAIEVPMPAQMLKHPVTGEEYVNPFYTQNEAVRARTERALPGQPIPLGRQLDSRFWSPADMEKVARKQNELPSEIPVDPDTVVPSDDRGERRT